MPPLRVDLHTQAAAEIFRVPYDEVTPEQRAKAKMVNFFKIYGADPSKLVPIEQAKRLRRDFDRLFPGVRRVIRGASKEA